MFVPNFEAISHVTFFLGTQKAPQKFGVKRNRIQKRLEYEKINSRGHMS